MEPSPVKLYGYSYTVKFSYKVVDRGLVTENTGEIDIVSETGIGHFLLTDPTVIIRIRDYLTQDAERAVFSVTVTEVINKNQMVLAKCN